jgi:hypothetical protein
MDKPSLPYVQPRNVRPTSASRILLPALGSGGLFAVGGWLGVRVLRETLYLITAGEGWARDFVELAAFGCMALCLFIGGLLLIYHGILYLRSGTGSFAEPAEPTEGASDNV